jgi:hypothetical protein
VPSDLPDPFTGWRRLAVAAYLARHGVLARRARYMAPTPPSMQRVLKGSDQNSVAVDTPARSEWLIGPMSADLQAVPAGRFGYRVAGFCPLQRR